MKTPRILHVVHGFPPESHGGIESYVTELMRGQSETTCEVGLLHGSFEPRKPARAVQKPGPYGPVWRLHRDDAYSDYWDRAYHLGAGRCFAEVLEQWRPEIVHLHQWIRLSCDLVQIAEDQGIATVVTLHDLSASCPACFRQRPDGSHCERRLSADQCLDCVPTRGHESERELREGIELFADSMRAELLRARRVLAATRATADLVQRGLRLEDLQIELQPLGYTKRFEDCQVPELAWQEGEELRFAYWGNVTARKGVDTLLQALRLLAERRELRGRLSLDIFGRCDSEELRVRLEELARGLPVRIRGAYQWQEIANAAPHIAVFPSDCFETYGFVLDEAFELGRPVLATGVGAFAERVGEGGWLVPPGAATALAETIERILADPSQVLEKAAKRPQVSQDAKEHCQTILQQYFAALAEHPHPVAGVPLERRLELEQMRRDGATLSPPAQRGLQRKLT
ncbi:MAG: hypothetical protein CSA62_14700 [Planctomycetota bacterium]|nr:MAG: hypothetical protein CSA62_14700 [Planctomycetota bacterium]